MRRFLLLLATLALVCFVTGWAGVALAHAELESAQPTPETTVTEPLSNIELSFTEPVELNFSLFKVYKLDAAVDLSAEDAWQRLNGLAGALVSEVLEAQDDDEARVDMGLANGERQSAEVVIQLEEELTPGTYVVMWRALSVDTHSVQGFYVFNYQPGD